jgi:hypothetical protein
MKSNIIIKILFSPFFIFSWFWKRMRSMVIFAFLIGLLGVGVLCAMYFYFIIAQPGKDFTRKAIMDALSRETPVYYDDGKNLIGVFLKMNIVFI